MSQMGLASESNRGSKMHSLRDSLVGMSNVLNTPLARLLTCAPLQQVVTESMQGIGYKSCLRPEPLEGAIFRIFFPALYYIWTYWQHASWLL